MFNKVILIGNLTKDPELRYTPQGTTVCSFNLAVNRKYKSGDETKEEVLFIGVVVFGKRGDSCGQYLNKGSKVLVEGRLKQQRWTEESSGQNRSKIEVNAEDVKFMSSPRQGDQSGPPDEHTDIEPF